MVLAFFPASIVRADTPAAVVTEGATPIAQGARETETKREVWYGWEPLILDGAAIASLAAAIASKSSAIVPASIVLYTFGGPLVHLARGHGLRGVGDFAMRVALPLVGGFVGYGIGSASSSRPDEDCGSGCGGSMLGALGGALLAVTLDATVLSFDGAERSEAARSTPSLAWSPSLAVTPNGARFGIGGSF